VSVNPELLSKALDAIKRNYGSESIRLGSDKSNVDRISTGSIQLDWATGGGVPLGRVVHFYGGYSSCKTLTSFSIIKNAQDMGLECAYYNVEKQFIPEWVEQRGIDLDKLHVVDGTEIETIGEKLEILLGSVHIHVIDSIASTVSVDELAGDVRDWNPGIQARAWGKALRRANARFNDKENLLILVNQTREVFGRMGGENPTSGRFIEYMSSLTLHFKRSSWLYKDGNGLLVDDGKKTDSITGDIQPAGMEFQVRVAKSRVGVPLRPARMRLDFETGQFDTLWELARGAVYFNVVKQGGSWYTLPNETKVQGEKGLREAIAKDKELEKTIIEKIMENA
jgi:recombination protein RecA